MTQAPSTTRPHFTAKSDHSRSRHDATGLLGSGIGGLSFCSEVSTSSSGVQSLADSSSMFFLIAAISFASLVFASLAVRASTFFLILVLNSSSIVLNLLVCALRLFLSSPRHLARSAFALRQSA